MKIDPCLFYLLLKDSKSANSSSNKAFDLWFDEFMTIWKGCSNSPPWQENLMHIFSWLGWNNIGHIDWSHYTPMFFSRLLAHFKLPMKWSPYNVSMKYSASSLWIVATIGDKGSRNISVMTHLTLMLEVINNLPLAITELLLFNLHRQ